MFAVIPHQAAHKPEIAEAQKETQTCSAPPAHAYDPVTQGDHDTKPVRCQAPENDTPHPSSFPDAPAARASACESIAQCHTTSGPPEWHNAHAAQIPQDKTNRPRPHDASPPGKKPQEKTPPTPHPAPPPPTLPHAPPPHHTSTIAADAPPPRPPRPPSNAIKAGIDGCNHVHFAHTITTVFPPSGLPHQSVA